MGNAGSIFCSTKDGNTLLNLNSSNFQLSGSYSNPVKCICDIEMDSMGCDGVCGIRVHFPCIFAAHTAVLGYGHASAETLPGVQSATVLLA